MKKLLTITAITAASLFVTGCGGNGGGASSGSSLSSKITGRLRQKINQVEVQKKDCERRAEALRQKLVELERAPAKTAMTGSSKGDSVGGDPKGFAPTRMGSMTATEEMRRQPEVTAMAAPTSDTSAVSGLAQTRMPRTPKGDSVSGEPKGAAPRRMGSMTATAEMRRQPDEVTAMAAPTSDTSAFESGAEIAKLRAQLDYATGLTKLCALKKNSIQKLWDAAASIQTLTFKKAKQIATDFVQSSSEAVEILEHQVRCLETAGENTDVKKRQLRLLRLANIEMARMVREMPDVDAQSYGDSNNGGSINFLPADEIDQRLEMMEQFITILTDDVPKEEELQAIEQVAAKMFSAIHDPRGMPAGFSFSARQTLSGTTEQVLGYNFGRHAVQTRLVGFTGKTDANNTRLMDTTYNFTVGKGYGFIRSQFASGSKALEVAGFDAHNTNFLTMQSVGYVYGAKAFQPFMAANYLTVSSKTSSAFGNHTSKTNTVFGVQAGVQSDVALTKNLSFKGFAMWQGNLNNNGAITKQLGANMMKLDAGLHYSKNNINAGVGYSVSHFGKTRHGFNLKLGVSF